MNRRVLFVAPGMNAALRQARFDDGAPLDAAGRAAAEAAAGVLPVPVAAVVSDSRRCRETAEALGLASLTAPAELAPPDRGTWHGRTLAEVSAAEPEAVARWLGDPEFAPGGGESLIDVCARVARWLDAAVPDDGGGPVVAVVEPDVVRAAVVHALGAPASSFWRCDVAPLTVTELSGRGGRWNVQMGKPLGPAGSPGRAQRAD